MTKKIKWNKGFTLVEIMIAAGLVAGLAVVLMNIQKQQAVSQKKAETSIEVTSIHSAIVSHLLNNQSCTNTLAPKGNITQAANQSVTQIRDRVNNVIFDTTKIYNNLLKIQSMTVSDVVITPAVVPVGELGYGELKLTITYEKVAKIIPGTAKTVTFELPMKVAVNSDFVVTNCYSAAENAVDTAKDETCKSLTDGVTGGFNVTTQKCVLNSHPATIATNIAVSTKFLDDYMKDTLDNRYVNVIGDTMTGGLTVSAGGIAVTGGATISTGGVNVPTGNVTVGAGSLSVTGGNINLTNGNFIQTNGYIQTDQYVTVSDKNLKKNFVSLDKVKDKIYDLQGVQFDWKKNGERDYGFIAQEVEKVLPIMVKTDPTTGIKAVKYTNLIPLMVEDMKALRQENIKLQKENRLLRKDINEIKSMLRKKK